MAAFAPVERLLEDEAAALGLGEEDEEADGEPEEAVDVDADADADAEEVLAVAIVAPGNYTTVSISIKQTMSSQQRNLHQWSNIWRR